MPLPELDKADPVVAERLQALEDTGNATHTRAVYGLACGKCGFSGADRSFTVFPDWAWKAPAELLRSLRDHAVDEKERKCPECEALAPVDMIRLFVASEALGGDLVVELAQGRITLRGLSRDGSVERLDDGDRRVAEACLDSCLRVAGFLAASDQDAATEAETLLRTVIAGRPNDAEPSLALASLLLDQQRIEEAMSAIEAASRHANGDLDSCLALGDLLGHLALAQRDKELLNVALGWFVQAREVDADDPRIALGSGRLLVQAGARKEAKAMLDQAALHEDTAADAVYQLGLLALQSDEPAQALKHFGRLATSSEDPDVFRMYAWSLHKCGRSGEALELLGRVEAADPGNPETEHFRHLISGDDD